MQQQSNDHYYYYYHYCPSQAELNAANCRCYPTTNDSNISRYMICDNVTSAIFTTTENNNNKMNENNDLPYRFKTLVIRNSPKLPFWNEHSTRIDSGFMVDKLILLMMMHNDSGLDVDKEQYIENLNELLRLPMEGVKILTIDHYNNQVTKKIIELNIIINLEYLSKSVSFISINNPNAIVKYDDDIDSDGFSDFLEDRLKLRHIQFRNVQFDPPIKNFLLQTLPSLKYIEFTNTNLIGTFSFVPANTITSTTTKNNKIFIKLIDNKNLTYFNFGLLFSENYSLNKSNQNNIYHIELRNNPMMRSDLLTSQLSVLEKNVGKLNLKLTSSSSLSVSNNNSNNQTTIIQQFDCNCELFNLFKNKLHIYIHGLKCNNQFGYLNRIKFDQCS